MATPLNTSTEMNENSEPTGEGSLGGQRGSLSRLARFIGRLGLAFIKLTALFIILAFLTLAAWIGFQELDRSFGVVNNRIDFSLEQTASARAELATVSESMAAQEVRLSSMERAAADQDEGLGQLDEQLESLSSDFTHQEELLRALEGEVSELTTSAETTGQAILTLNDGVVALQGDITTNGSRLDDLGGEFDTLASDLAGTNNEVTNLDTEMNVLSDTLAVEADAAFAEVRQTLKLFRIWEMVARARLRLAENNIGLASGDIALAIAALDSQLNTIEDEESVDSLELVRLRLSLAAANLAANPQMAARDLDTAWEALDTELSASLGLEPLVGVTANETLTITIAAPPVPAITATDTVTETSQSP